MSPTVSIITISKDDPDGLGASVASALDQTFTDFELIVVRSGRSQQLALPEDPRLIVRDTPARGISHALNEGLQTARGTWVQFLNGGDSYASRDALQILSEHTGSPVGLVSSFAQVGRRAFTIPRRRLRPGKDSFIYVSHQATLFRAALFDQFGTFSPGIRIHMDLEWLTRLPPQTRYKFLDRVTVNFDPHGISATEVVSSSIEEADILWRSPHYRARAPWVLLLLLPFRVVRKVYRRFA